MHNAYGNMQLNCDLLGEISGYWHARALGLTCKQLRHLLDITRYIIERTEVDEHGSVVTSRRLPDGRLHGESTVSYDDGSIRRITSHLGVSTVCTNIGRAIHSSGKPYARRSIHRGHEYNWYYGSLTVYGFDSDGRPCTEIAAECTLDECDAKIAQHVLDRPHGDIITLDIAFCSPCFDMPGLVWE